MLLRPTITFHAIRIIPVKIKDTGEKDAYGMAERESYANLFEYIRSEIIPNKEIVSVAFLCSKLESFMLSCGINNLHDSTRKHIHRKLLCELANSVKIFTDDKGKLLMVPDSVTLKDVAVELQSLRRELETWKVKETDLNKIVDQASLKVRLAIKEGTKPTPWPYHPSDASSDVNLSIPPQLEFLIGLLTGDPEVKSPAHRISTLFQSISQDIIYAVKWEGAHLESRQVPFWSHYMIFCLILLDLYPGLCPHLMDY